MCEFFQVVCRYLADHLLTPALRCANVLLPKPASNVASAALREMTGGDDQLPPKVSRENEMSWKNPINTYIRKSAKIIRELFESSVKYSTRA